MLAWLPPRVAALGLVAALIAAVTVALVSYRGGLAGTVPVFVDSGRSGLSMQSGAAVKMHGVQVGRVRAVRQEGGGAVLELNLDRVAAQDIPADVGAQISSSTVFGTKYVTLLDAGKGAAQEASGLAAGTVIPADHVSVELNSVFENLSSVLKAVEPEKLNAVLGAVATALDGRGAALGQSLEDADRVLSSVNAIRPQLESDIRGAASAAGLYADVAPDLLAVIDNLAVTGDTVVDRRADLDRLLLEVTGLGTVGSRVLGARAPEITTVLNLMRPTTALLSEYAPGLTCFLQGADETRKLAEPVSGGNGRTMLLKSALILGDPAYTYQQDLPRVQASGGPRCGGLPKLSMDQVPAPYLVADTGSNPYRAGNTGPVLNPTTLLRLLTGAPSGAAR
ncbi:MCE family protein [Rhodococcus spelaei]|uniref:MCE family protein n=1 Tax=Rhodococcus spelaei TaxID=2546320 RepID=A0A541BRH5_9NOCA|nr:MCE family protein [Rhodococcus spelaei]TQF74942.1 MCE family protein [Rhodococcus spelaei]